MQAIGKTRIVLFLSTALCMSVGIASGQSQGSPSPAQNQTNPNCNSTYTNGMPASSSDAACAPLAPNFAVPSTNMPSEDPSKHQVTAVVRVDAVIPKPDRVPFPIEHTTVGSATMIKMKMPRLAACYKAGQAISDRSGASTSTTCLDHKGEVIAYQECKPKVGDTAGSCSTVVPNPATDTVASAKP